MIFLKIKLNNHGYTLAETLAVIAIIGIMSAVLAADYGSNRQNIFLKQAAGQIIADLRAAQNMAMNTAKFNGEIPGGGYGINISVSFPGAYIVYADCDGDHLYGNSSSCGAASNIAEKISDRVLANGINITAVGNSDIVFQPPQPIVWIGGVANAVSSTIIIRYGAAGPAKIITVNGITGQITAN